VNKGYKGCADIADCELKDVFCKVTNAISGIVDEITLQDLVTKRQKRKNVSDYAI
jgi:DNA-binding IscR family transcriptional regulator